MTDQKVIFCFTVPGDPVGFVSSGKKTWSKRQGKAWAYATYVRKCAPQHILEFCKHAGPGTPQYVRTVAYFRTGVHPDPENVHKLCKDALYYDTKGGDKHTGGCYAPPEYVCLEADEEPRVEITIANYPIDLDT